MKNSKNSEIEKLENEVKLCNYRIEKEKLEDSSNYYCKAKALLKLGNITNNNQMYGYAITAFTKAVELSPENPLFLIERAKLYASVGKTNLAIQDFQAIEILKQDGEVDPNSLISIHVNNTLKNLSNLESIQKTIIALKANNSLPQAFLESYVKLTQVTSNLVVTVDKRDPEITTILRQIEEMAQEIVQLKENHINYSRAKNKIIKVTKIAQALLSEQKKLGYKVDNLEDILDEINSRVEQHNTDIIGIKTYTEELTEKFDLLLESVSGKLRMLVEEFVQEKSNVENIKSLLIGFIDKSVKDNNIRQEQIVVIKEQLDLRIDKILQEAVEIDQTDIQVIVSSLTKEVVSISKEIEVNREDIKYINFEVEKMSSASHDDHQKIVIIDQRLTNILSKSECQVIGESMQSQDDSLQYM